MIGIVTGVTELYKSTKRGAAASINAARHLMFTLSHLSFGVQWMSILTYAPLLITSDLQSGE